MPGRAALRDFKPAYVSCGSRARISPRRGRRPYRRIDPKPDPNSTSNSCTADRALPARLAAEAGEMTIGLGILLLNLHNPVYTAETVATLDIIASSRQLHPKQALARTTRTTARTRTMCPLSELRQLN